MTAPDPTTDAKIAELKAATRAANEALADLKEARKDAATFLREELGAVDRMLERHVEATMEKFGATVQKHIDEATEAVFRRFDKIATTLLGKKGKSIEAYIDALPDKEAPSPR